MLKPEDFFDLAEFEHRDLFEGVEYIWDGLKRIKEYIREVIRPNLGAIRKRGDVLSKTYILYQGEVLEEGFELFYGDSGKGRLKVRSGKEDLVGATVLYAGVTLLSDHISIGKGTVVEPGALIKGPTIIGENTEVRQGAYIRGDVIVGDRCVVGHTTEIKGSIMLNDAKAGHFAYIGDSILGNRVNLGAGTKLANLKIFDSPVKLVIDGKEYETNLRKFGAILGDDVETGCNTVTSPGTLLGKNVLAYPNTLIRGYYPPNTIIKLRQNQEVSKRIYNSDIKI
ncbi:MAG: glucose-1-phosphate thymidylyltransferase [bacterium]|nr:glucose-1-phosphate thymidylyltransferase [bacterium]